MPGEVNPGNVRSLRQLAARSDEDAAAALVTAPANPMTIHLVVEMAPRLYQAGQLARLIADRTELN